MKPGYENNIRLSRIYDTSQYLPQIDRSDAGEDFYDAVAENSEEIFAIFYKDTVIGLSYIEDDSEGFIFIYIFPGYRNRSFGYSAASAAEQQMKSSPLLSITTAYNNGNKAAKRFSEKCGYVKKYSSAFMKYPGKMFPEPELPVRHYRDEDFIEAFSLSSEAFHLMRLGTGCFPDSTLSEPDEETRKRWAESADDEYVFVQDGEIAGYARIDGNELDSVSIKVSHQGKGMGRKFVEFLINRILEKDKGNPVLWCVVGNGKARRLYDSLGFREIFIEDFAVKKISSDLD